MDISHRQYSKNNYFHNQPIAFTINETGGRSLLGKDAAMACGLAIQRWAQTRNINLAYIQPGKPWQNGFAESFVGTCRTEVLNADVFHSIDESGIVSSAWLHMYNNERPHGKHNYQPPVSAFTKNAA